MNTKRVQHYGRGNQQNYLFQNDSEIGQLDRSLLPDHYMEGDLPLMPDDSINPANYHFIDQRYQLHPNYGLSNGDQQHPLFMDTGRSNPIFNHTMFHPSYSISNPFSNSSPISDLRQQYSQLQQDKMQERMKVETEALIEQQHKFALRQQLNPPVARDPSIYASGVNLEQYRSHSLTDSASSASTMPLKISNQSNSIAMQDNNINSQELERHGMYSTNQGQLVQSPDSNQQSAPNTNANRQMVPQPSLHLRGLYSNYGEQRLMEGQNQSTQTVPLTATYSDRLQNAVQSDPLQTPNSTKIDNSTNPFVYKKPLPSSVNSPTKLQKSPVTKRPNASTVTFSGWLYKQGSDGLRVWRKRWFVLSDYILYYYKSAEEEKLLGSILLPSYNVSICLPDSKNYRKHSFKLDHKNMRPILLASDNIEGMYKWIRILDAATRMQKYNDGIPLDNSLYGSGYISNASTVMDIAGNFDSLPDSPMGDGKLVVVDGKYKQPLYVNAPPKPRRSRNELGYWTLTSNSSQFLAEQARDLQNASKNPFAVRSPSFEYEDIGRQNRSDLNLNREAGRMMSNSSRNKQLFEQFWPIRSRPGSVDLFEHDLKESRNNTPQAKYTFLRSKSSLEINNSSDNYFYSEANYAAKMRQSAHYLQNASPNKNIEHSIKDQLAKLSKTRSRENSPRQLTEQRYAEKTTNGNSQQDSMKRMLVWKQKMSASPQARNQNSDLFSLPRNSANIKRISRSIDHINTEHLRTEYGHRMGHSSDEDGILDRRLLSNYLSASQNRINDINNEYFDQYDILAREHERDTLTSDDISSIFSNMDISAGSLLTKTQEELILLLIQLRRQNILTERTIDMCNAEMKSLLTNLQSCSNVVALREYKDRLDRLSKQVMKLERQYEKKRPLINLLDNMVKLGALYQNRKKSLRRSQTILETKTQPREQLQFLRDAQERNILKDERQYWTENNPNQRDLQQKVNKLFKLEQAIQNESNMLHDFQKNKLNIKGKLNELNNVSNNKIMSTAALFDQQMKKDYLEQELSGVHDHMATKSRKLEREISGNLRLENELLALKQKFEIGNASKMGDIETGSSDLTREQQSCRDLQRQRQELSQAVSDFTKYSNLHQLENLNMATKAEYLSASSSYSSNKLPNWSETDLDFVDPKTPHSIDAQNWQQGSYHNNGPINNSLASALRVEQILQNSGDMGYLPSHGSGQTQANVNNNVDIFNNMNNLGLLDKQEIKTVRIVKRESEKRHRDREKGGVYGTSQLDDPYESDLYEQDITTKSYTTDPSKNYFINDKNPFINFGNKSQTDKFMSETSMLFSNLSLADNFTSGLNDASGFKSESARHIISELDETKNHHLANMQSDADQYRRSTPKKKKRHFTAPNTMNSQAMQSYLDGNVAHDNNDRWRACDDLDMEVALRSHISTTKT